MTGLRVGGLAPLSSCDWPGQLVATVFCRGCPWDCAYCHNPHLIPARGDGQIPWPDVVRFLERRRGLLDGVVFSGGEPTAQAALPDAIREARALGFGIGLHTGGPFPDRLAAALPLLDWVGFDVKAPFGEYERITGVAGSGDKAHASLRQLLDSKVRYETRTTVDSRLLDTQALARLRADLSSLGADPHRLQLMRGGRMIT